MHITTIINSVKCLLLSFSDEIMATRLASLWWTPNITPLPCKRSTEQAQRSVYSSSGRGPAASSSGVWILGWRSRCFWLPVGLLYPWCLGEKTTLSHSLEYSSGFLLGIMSYGHYQESRSVIAVNEFCCIKHFLDSFVNIMHPTAFL